MLTLLKNALAEWRAELRVYHAPAANSADTRAQHIIGIPRLTPAMADGNMPVGRSLGWGLTG